MFTIVIGYSEDWTIVGERWVLVHRERKEASRLTVRKAKKHLIKLGAIRFAKVYKQYAYYAYVGEKIT